MIRGDVVSLPKHNHTLSPCRWKGASYTLQKNNTNVSTNNSEGLFPTNFWTPTPARREIRLLSYLFNLKITTLRVPSFRKSNSSWFNAMQFLSSLLNNWSHLFLNIMGNNLDYLFFHRADHCTWHTEAVCTSQHGTLILCWVNVGPASQTKGHHWFSTGSKHRVCWDVTRGVQVIDSLHVTAWKFIQLLKFTIIKTATFSHRLEMHRMFIIDNVVYANPSSVQF